MIAPPWISWAPPPLPVHSIMLPLNLFFFFFSGCDTKLLVLSQVLLPSRPYERNKDAQKKRKKKAPLIIVCGI
jgi:hypothetical protein